MKKIIIAITLITGFLSFAQKDFQGMAVYESKTTTADFMKNIEGNKDITPEMKAQIAERMKKAFEKTFILNFDKNASIYKEEEKLDAPGQGGAGRMKMMTSFMGGGGTYYKNIKEKSYTVDKEVFGKEFLIKDSLPKYNWVLTEETKKIGDYTCFKATTTIEPSKSDFRNMRMKREEQRIEKKLEKQGNTTGSTTEENKKDEKEKAKTTNFMDQVELPKEITITAWYCPEIPINQGPEGYWGLPGLILEVSDGKTIILCSKLALNTKDKVEIKAPTGGDKVTQKEFDEIMMKKMEEMQQMNGGNGRGGFQMRMGR